MGDLQVFHIQNARNANVKHAAETFSLQSLALPQQRRLERMLHAPALLACVPVVNGVLPGHPNTPMWIRIMQVKLFSLSCCIASAHATMPLTQCVGAESGL
jgi:hypothetical protein